MLFCKRIADVFSAIFFKRTLFIVWVFLLHYVLLNKNHMKSIYLFCIVLFTVTPSFSQQKDTISIKGRFDVIYNTSNSYKEYKIIKKSRLNTLRNRVSDSIHQQEG